MAPGGILLAGTLRLAAPHHAPQYGSLQKNSICWSSPFSAWQAPPVAFQGRREGWFSSHVDQMSGLASFLQQYYCRSMSDASRPTSPALAEFALLESWLASSPLPNCPSTRSNPDNSVAARCSACCCKPTWTNAATAMPAPPLAVTSRVPMASPGVTPPPPRHSHDHHHLGPVQIERLGYSQPGAPSVYPLDQALALPARSFSYELQRRLVKAAVLNPFQESVNSIAELTGVTVPKRSVEQIVGDAAQDFDAFYQQRLPAPDSGPILVAAIDCKGIPMVKPETTALPPPSSPTRRLTANAWRPSRGVHPSPHLYAHR
jgi:hypothetical protein